MATVQVDCFELEKACDKGIAEAEKEVARIKSEQESRGQVGWYEWLIEDNIEKVDKLTLLKSLSKCSNIVLGHEEFSLISKWYCN